MKKLSTWILDHLGLLGLVTAVGFCMLGAIWPVCIFIGAGLLLILIVPAAWIGNSGEDGRGM